MERKDNSLKKGWEDQSTSSSWFLPSSPKPGLDGSKMSSYHGDIKRNVSPPSCMIGRVSGSNYDNKLKQQIHALFASKSRLQLKS